MPSSTHDAQAVVERAVAANFLPADHGLDPGLLFEYVSGPYGPFLTERFTYTKDWTAKALQTVIDLQGATARSSSSSTCRRRT